jgi:hypothetical protein
LRRLFKQSDEILGIDFFPAMAVVEELPRIHIFIQYLSQQGKKEPRLKKAWCFVLWQLAGTGLQKSSYGATDRFGKGEEVVRRICARLRHEWDMDMLSILLGKMIHGKINIQYDTFNS